jgi:hypothetical protein
VRPAPFTIFVLFTFSWRRRSFVVGETHQKGTARLEESTWSEGTSGRGGERGGVRACMPSPVAHPRKEEEARGFKARCCVRTKTTRGEFCFAKTKLELSARHFCVFPVFFIAQPILTDLAKMVSRQAAQANSQKHASPSPPGGRWALTRLLSAVQAGGTSG